jgi:hypothetical protein
MLKQIFNGVAQQFLRQCQEHDRGRIGRLTLLRSPRAIPPRQAAGRKSSDARTSAVAVGLDAEFPPTERRINLVWMAPVLASGACTT